MKFIQMENIEKSFDGAPVLRDVSLYMDKGEVVSIIGPSGSGKSTFLRCLCQLETIDRGNISVEGAYLAKTEGPGRAVYVREEEARNICLRMGMVFQQFNLFPHMTVLENIMAAPKMVKNMREEEILPVAKQLLEKVGLWNKKDVYPSRLSGGAKTTSGHSQSIGNESGHYAL